LKLYLSEYEARVLQRQCSIQEIQVCHIINRFIFYLYTVLVPSYLESSYNWDTNTIFIWKTKKSCDADMFTCCVTILISVTASFKQPAHSCN
jgi:hypothetical protein